MGLDRAVLSCPGSSVVAEESMSQRLFQVENEGN